MRNDTAPFLALPNDPERDIRYYCKLLWISPILFEDHLVAILQVSLVDKSL